MSSGNHPRLLSSLPPSLFQSTAVGGAKMQKKASKNSNNDTMKKKINDLKTKLKALKEKKKNLKTESAKKKYQMKIDKINKKLDKYKSKKPSSNSSKQQHKKDKLSSNNLNSNSSYVSSRSSLSNLLTKTPKMIIMKKSMDNDMNPMKKDMTSIHDKHKKMLCALKKKLMELEAKKQQQQKMTASQNQTMYISSYNDGKSKKTVLVINKKGITHKYVIESASGMNVSPVIKQLINK